MSSLGTLVSSTRDSQVDWSLGLAITSSRTALRSENAVGKKTKKKKPRNAAPQNIGFSARLVAANSRAIYHIQRRTREEVLRNEK